MEQISVFEMLKIGVGPSSSHTLGPWIASQRFIKELIIHNIFSEVSGISVELFGSLSMTGVGHATDIAVVLGLLGEDPITIEVKSIDSKIKTIKDSNKISLNDSFFIDFEIWQKENSFPKGNIFYKYPSEMNYMNKIFEAEIPKMTFPPGPLVVLMPCLSSF